MNHAMRGIQVFLVLFVLGMASSAGAAAPEGAWLDRATLEVLRGGNATEIRCAVANPLDREVQKTLEVTIADLDGNVIVTGSRAVALSPGRNSCSLTITGSVPEEKISLGVIKYRLGTGSDEEKGARSLLDALPQLETRLVAYRDLQAGSKASLRLVAFNHATSAAVKDASVVIKLAVEKQERALFTGQTGADGSIEAGFDVPGDVKGGAELRIEISAAGLGQDRIVQPVDVKRDTKILLTTDKPLYQPGQLIQMRALSLRAADLGPEAKQPFLFEVMDSKGNKVFKYKTETDDFGVASAKFELATEVNLGSYIVRAILGDAQTEKQVTVDKYVLPKFKAEVKTDREYYTPGETLKGEVQADYFFGKPVAGGKVKVTASKFEIQFEKFAEAEGKLDENGHWSFEIALPAYFAGTPIEQGKASVRLEVEVVDTADHREEKVVMKPVAAAPLNIFAVPESGALVPGLENRVYILVSYPDGSPAADAAVLVEGMDVVKDKSEDHTDALGIATVIVKPGTVTHLRQVAKRIANSLGSNEQPSSQITLTVRAHDKQGRNAEQQVTLSTKPLGESLILRTDKTLYQVGDTLHAEVFIMKTKGTVYFDLVRQGQTVMTRTAEISAGKASLAMDIDAAMSGSLVIQAYTFTPTTDLVRDTRLLYVNPANDLNIGIEIAHDTYKPGEKAQVKFRITDRAGGPTAAAIGIAIVDESVFALQEIHPGLEKVYFTLEKEIMKPRYEIHGYSIDDLVMRPVPGNAEPQLGMKWSEEQQKAACVLLASAPAVPEPPLRVNTFDEKRKQADEAISAAYQRAYEHIQQAVSRYLQKNGGKAPEDMSKALLREKLIRPPDLVDPWGNPYEFDFSQVEPLRGYFTMLSYGPDGMKGTGDDISPETFWGRDKLQRARGGVRLGMAPKEMAIGEGGEVFFAAPPAPGAMPEAAAPKEQLRALGYLAKDEKKAMAQDMAANAEAGPAPPRIREYFPETLLFKPALIADAQGLATLEFDLADSITTWRMTTMASSRGGALGSKEAPLRVFQDFFVDLDLPVALTQHDRVSIPVVAYNYLDTVQDVKLKFEVEPWFKLDGNAEQTLKLASKEVRSMYFPIEVVELGKHRLTVSAYGTKMNDAIRREIEVLPDGEEQNVTFSGRISGPVEHAVAIPPDAIPGASKILVRVYPGVFSQIVDGLDSMLQMPSGCFEQTSATTYPNILIVQYLKATKLIKPEIQMKAEGFINAGYQRLLSYEVQGGGFSWFGDAPANKVLTAWGVKEFDDMSKVHEVDPAVIARTQAWLLGKQEPDGSWKPDAQYLHAESWSGIQNSSLLVTAYIADALLSTGEKGGGMQKAIEYIKNNWKDGAEAYTLALVANALVSWNADDPSTQQVLAKLYDMRKEEKDIVYWKGGAGTVTFTHGDAADIETTSLAAIAFMKAGKYPETATKALTYLIQKKSAAGHWGSTQATILALKALMTALGSQMEKANASVTVALNGATEADLKITPEDCDVMRLVDLGEKTKSGDNRVALSFAGEGSMMYQVVGRYYMPWAQRKGPEEPLTIEVAYDKTQLAVNDLVTASVKVTNHRPATAQMTIIDLGIPPGFQVTAPDLDALVQKGVIQKYEMTGRQIITYFNQIGPNAVIEFSYTLRAKFPLRAQTPKSRVYEYYNPEISGTAKPQQLVVE